MLQFLATFLSVTFFIGRLYARYRYRKWVSKLRYREQLLLSLIGAAIAGAIIGGRYLYQQWYYEPAPAPYATMDQAETDGCIIIRSPFFLERGRERWEDFCTTTGYGLPDRVSIAVWDGGECQVVNHIFFDGEAYHYDTHNGLLHSDRETVSYPYLLHLTYEPGPDSSELYSYVESYVLTDKADLTGEEYAHRIVGSDTGFRYACIVADYTWK